MFMYLTALYAVKYDLTMVKWALFTYVHFLNKKRRKENNKYAAVITRENLLRLSYEYTMCSSTNKISSI